MNSCKPSPEMSPCQRPHCHSTCSFGIAPQHPPTILPLFLTHLPLAPRVLL